LILSAIFRIGRRAVRGVAPALIAVAAFALMTFTLTPFPAIVLGAGLLGWLLERIRPGLFAAPAATHAASAAPAQVSPSSTAAAPIVLDDNIPAPRHAQLYWPRWIAMAAIFLVLIAAPLVGLALWRGTDDVFARMGRFFTLTAFVTIGGAYAVLPYVTEMATSTYDWLARGQMIDGLALGETTPGPLVLVLTFVGFVGGWRTQYANMGVWGGLCGAAIATYFTFLPSFMFILLGAPFVERSRGEIRLGAILTAITAAVAGVIANMALLFGRHVLFPETSGRFDAISLSLIVLAYAALEWKKVNVVAVVLGCGALGVLLRFGGMAAG